MAIDARARLILALDFPLQDDDPERLMRPEDAFRAADVLGEQVGVVKVGWPLVIAGGHAVIAGLIERGLRVFLDLKSADIGETVGRMVRAAAAEGVSFVTLLGQPAAARAAAAARGPDAEPRLLAVTLLTSQDAGDLAEMGISLGVEEYVLRQASQARAAGLDGVIASGREARLIRERLGPDCLIVTPGIRPAGSSADDQKRVLTPGAAIADGADYLVVGRPITKAAQPRDVAARIVDEMQRAFDRRG